MRYSKKQIKAARFLVNALGSQSYYYWKDAGDQLDALPPSQLANTLRLAAQFSEVREVKK